jgi:hypothetical protein
MTIKAPALPRLSETDHRAEAAACAAEEARSFRDSDTDGFVSQWASNRMASYHRMSADLAANGNIAEHAALFDLEGNVASTHRAEGQWGTYWVMNDAFVEAGGKRFLTLSKASKAARRNAANRAKGVTVGRIAVESRTDMVGSGRGLGAALTVRTIVVPNVTALRAGDFTIVATDDDTMDW